MLEALNERPGDIEDIIIAERRLADIRAGRSRVFSSEEVERMLNVDN